MGARSRFELGTANASVSFRVRWFGVVNVSGRFEGLTGIVLIGTCDEDHAVSVEVAAGSVRTGIGLRDRHLRGPRFLGSEQDPMIRFESDRVTRRNGIWEVRGQLTLRGRTRAVSLTIDDQPSSGTMRQLSGAFRIPRRPHGIGTASGLRRLNPLLWAIGDEVTVNVEMLVPATLLQEVEAHVPSR